MARIRTIKPEFPQSESIGALSRDARLLYIQLWTIVDDEGKARAASRMLASLLYPYDDDARGLIDGWLDELEHGNHLRRYEVDGSQYLEITKWLEHQKIDRPSKSRLPSFVEASRMLASVRRGFDADLGPSTLDLVSSTAPVADAPEPKAVEKKSRRKPKLPISEGYSLPQRIRDYGATLGFTANEIDREVQRFIRHAQQNDRRCADWDAAASNWFDKAAEYAGKPAPVSQEQQEAAKQALSSMYYAKAESEQLEAWDQHSMATRGKLMPRDKNFGWFVPSEWPPDYKPQQRTLDVPQLHLNSMQ